jgi:protein-S-isoprenylcysteine O-methyltransferase Ste14
MVGLFATGPTSLVFYVAYSLWFFSEAIGAWLIPALRRRGATRVRRDRGSGLLIFLGFFVAIPVVLSFGYSGLAGLPDWIFYPGIFLILLGVLVRQWAIAVLGRFFSLTVRVAEDHRVVDRGPYRLVRHPSYTGALIALVGLSLAVQSWGALLVVLIVFGVGFGYRIRVEEKALRSQLGDDYVSYMKRTKRLIPFLF